MVKGLVDLGRFGRRGGLGTKEDLWFLTNGLACVLEKKEWETRGRRRRISVFWVSQGIGWEWTEGRKLKSKTQQKPCG